MTLEQALLLANHLLYQATGKCLSDVETVILVGSWQNQTYDQIAENAGYADSYLRRDIGPKLWKKLSQVLGEKVSKTSFKAALERKSKTDLNQKFDQHQDWGEAIETEYFWGRISELNQLKTWILKDNCKLIALLGLGGVGKSTVAIKLAKAITSEFDLVIWRSLTNAPLLNTLLIELIPFLSGQQDNEMSLKRLLYWLENRRCLIILDNFETLFEPKTVVGQYRLDYEDYGKLLRLIGENNHQSCLLLTSREKPLEVAELEGVKLSVRSWNLRGSLETGMALLNAKGLKGSRPEKQQLAEHYRCNPLALKILATAIQDLFDGEISPFLSQNTFVFNSINRLLTQQFSRLSDLEQKIMYLLAIHREWTRIEFLTEQLSSWIEPNHILDALESLRWRSLLENRQDTYTLQPVVMEYVTEHLVKTITTELISLNFSLFLELSLTPTNVQDYLHQTQLRLILEPIAKKLTQSLTAQTYLSQQCHKILKQLKQYPKQVHDYGSGNFFNLTRYLAVNLSDYDFSSLSICHGHLQGRILSNVNFTKASLINCQFTQTFGSIFSLKFSHDGQLLATGDSGGKIRLWCFPDLTPLMTLNGHNSYIWDLAFSQDNRYLMSSSEDTTIKLWEISTGQELRQFQGHSQSVLSVSLHPHQSIFASGGMNNQIKIWHLKTGICEQTLKGHENFINQVAFSPDGNTLATCSNDRTIKLWNWQQGTCLNTLRDHDHFVRGITWSPDDHWLVSCSEDQTVKLWDWQQGSCAKTLRGHQHGVWSVQWSPDGQILASGDVNGQIRLWNVEKGETEKTLHQHNNWVWSLAWSPNGESLASTSHDGTLRFWQPATGKCLRTLQGYQRSQRTLVWGQLGDQLICGGDDQRIHYFDFQSKTWLANFLAHESLVSSLAISQDEQFLATVSHDRSLKIWQLNANSCLSKVLAHDNWIWSVSWHPQGDKIATGSVDQTVKIWHFPSLQCLYQLAGHQSWVLSVVWSPDGQFLASGSADHTVRLWENETGNCQHTLPHPDVIWCVAWSPDSRYLAVGCQDHHLWLWDVQQGTYQRLTGHQGTVKAIAWSREGQLMASGDDVGNIKLWSGKDGSCLNTREGHDRSILALSFHPQQPILVSSSEDESLKFWEVNTGDCIHHDQVIRPYEGMNLQGTSGLTLAQQQSLQLLGAKF